MSDFTILSRDQIYDKNKQLEIFNGGNFDKNVLGVKLSDFAAVLGQQQHDEKKYSPYYWTSTLKPIKSIFKRNEKNKEAYFAYRNTGDLSHNVDQSLMGTRVAIKYSSIKNECDNSYYDKNIKIVEYGEYPQHYSDTFIEQTKLEIEYKNNTVEKTGKKYTIRVEDKSTEGKFIFRRLDEYEYKGHKYVRYEPLSINPSIKENSFWFLVEPVRWLVDEKSDIAVSESVLFSGVCLNDGLYYGDFENSYLKKFLDNYFSKEIVKNNGNNYIEDNSSVFDEDFIDDRIVPKTEEPAITDSISPLESKTMQTIQGRISDNIERAGKSLDKMNDKSNEIIKKSFDSDKKEESVFNKDDKFSATKSSSIEEITSDNPYAPLKNGRKIYEQKEGANRHLNIINDKADEIIKKNSEKSDDNKTSEYDSFTVQEMHDKLNRIFEELLDTKENEDDYDNNFGFGSKRKKRK